MIDRGGFREHVSVGLFAVFLIFLFSSCVYKNRSLIQENDKRSSYTNFPLFIQMPENILVFENISHLVYKSLYEYFRCVGYNLVDSDKNSYILKTEITKLNPVDKFISPDLLTYGSIFEMEILCKAFDKEKKFIVQKNFTFSTLVFKSKNSKLNSSFFDFEFSKMMQKRVAPRIEQYFRIRWL